MAESPQDSEIYSHAQALRRPALAVWRHRRLRSPRYSVCMYIVSTGSGPWVAARSTLSGLGLAMSLPLSSAKAPARNMLSTHEDMRGPPRGASSTGSSSSKFVIYVRNPKDRLGEELVFHTLIRR